VKVQAFISSPQNRSLTLGINQNERLSARAPGNHGYLRLHAIGGKLLEVNFPRVVVAYFSDVAGSHSPRLTCEECGSNLPAGEHTRGTKTNLRAWSRELGKIDQGIGGVESDAHHIDLRRFSHLRKSM
jgi:hypothetical protein